MDKIAIISGVYGDVEALKNVLSDIESRGITEVYCLGNSIKEGQDNSECLSLITEKCAVTLTGDKEEQVTLLGEIDGYNLKDIAYLANMAFSYQFFMSGRLIRMFNNNPYNSFNKHAYDNNKSQLFKPSIRTGRSYADVVVYGNNEGTLAETVDNRTLIGVQNVSSSGSSSDLEGYCANYIIIEGNKDSKDFAPISYQHVKVFSCIDVDRDLGTTKRIGTM